MKSLRDRRVRAISRAIRSGDVDTVRSLLAEHPTLATDRIGNKNTSRTVLHVATDWPAHFPRSAESITALVEAGAPVDGRFAGPHEETALHWAASANDLAALDALLDAGANIEANGAVLTGGTPLADAVVFEQWDAARRLVERGAAMTIWQAAGLGEVDAVRAALVETNPPPEEINSASWHACRAGNLETVKLLLSAGADLDLVGPTERTPRQVAQESGHAALIAWLDTV